MEGTEKLRNNQIDKVICQIRYNPIFSCDEKIGSFQAAISSEYPKSSMTTEGLIPLFPNAPPLNNYSFSTEDGCWQINVTNSFMALSCNKYESWVDFKTRLEWIVSIFFEHFKVDLLERVGLRYINAIRPSNLFGIEGTTDWSTLLAPEIHGMLGLFQDDTVGNYKSTIDANLGKCMVASSIGTIRFNDNNETGFLIDNDLYQTSVNRTDLSKCTDELNEQAFLLFKRMVTDKLLSLME